MPSEIIKVETTKLVIVVGRDKALVENAVGKASERGFTTYGALTNEQARELLKRHGPENFGACLLGNVFCNAEWENELKELTDIMQENAIPVRKCPTYADVITPLFKLGLYQPFKQPAQVENLKRISGDPNFELPADFGVFPQEDTGAMLERIKTNNRLLAEQGYITSGGSAATDGAEIVAG